MVAMQQSEEKKRHRTRGAMTPKSARSASATTPARRTPSHNLQDALREAAEAENHEVAELRHLLSRTSHVPAPGHFKRVQDVATSSLRRLDDGQNDDIATLRRRRKMEELEATSVSGRPKWDSSVWAYVPPALKGCNPMTPEPWAKDGKVYRQGLEQAYGSDTPKHAMMIENAMFQYHSDLGAGGSMLLQMPVSSRLRRTWTSATGITPRATPSAAASKAAAAKDKSAARRARIAARLAAMHGLSSHQGV